jgi:hypothetical protein
MAIMESNSFSQSTAITESISFFQSMAIIESNLFPQAWSLDPRQWCASTSEDIQPMSYRFRSGQPHLSVTTISVRPGVSKGIEDDCRLPALQATTPEMAIRPLQRWPPQDVEG